MPITVTCPACQNTLKVKDEYAGKKGKCPKCQALMPIPGPAAAAPAAVARTAAAPAARPAAKAPAASSAPAKPAAPSPAAPPPPAAPAEKSPEEIHAAVLAAFQGKCQPPAVSIGAKLGIVFVLLILLVLPLFYLAALGGLGFGIYLLATAELGLSPTIEWLAVAAAVFLLLCLLKPLFEPRRRSVQGYPLAKDKERLLTELVAKVCEQIDAPSPNAIVLECSTRLAAEYRAGVIGWLRRDEVLTVGLPLLASLSVEQFAGLVAGQMAQFRRRAGCRATNAIRAINGWLWRSIYDDGRFDDWLRRATSRPGLNAGKLLWPLRGIKLVAQAVLWIPMFIGNTVASGLVKRTELDGDRCHARLIGGTTFADVLPRLKIIDYTWQGLLTELSFRHRDQSLPDSLPQQLALQMVDMTPDICAILLETAVKTEEKPFDSRPADAERLSAAASEPKAGVFRCELPASSLLAAYPATAKTMTWDYYTAAFGSQLLRTALKKV